MGVLVVEERTHELIRLAAAALDITDAEVVTELVLWKIRDAGHLDPRAAQRHRSSIRLSGCVPRRLDGGRHVVTQRSTG